MIEKFLSITNLNTSIGVPEVLGCLDDRSQSVSRSSETNFVEVRLLAHETSYQFNSESETDAISDERVGLIITNVYTTRRKENTIPVTQSLVCGVVVVLLQLLT